MRKGKERKGEKRKGKERKGTNVWELFRDLVELMEVPFTMKINVWQVNDNLVVIASFKTEKCPKANTGSNCSL